MQDPRVRLILNPHAGAGSGSASRRLGDIVTALRELDLTFEIARTTGPGDATRLARASFDDGIDILAIAGGDGTLNEVIQAYITPQGTALEGPELALLPVGTGGDFRRSLKVPTNIRKAAKRLRTGKTVRVDAVLVNLLDAFGRPVTRAYINVMSFGIGGVTDALVNATPKWLGGKASFLIGAARAMLRYTNQHVQVYIDNELWNDGPVFNVALANGQFFGGGMHIAPQASVRDGLLEVVCIGNLTALERLELASRIYKGSHLTMDKVSCIRAHTIEARAQNPSDNVLIDMDGEAPGKLPITVRVIAGAVAVRI